MNDYTTKQIVSWVLYRLGHYLLMMDVNNDANDINVYINYIKYRSRFIKDNDLLQFINYHL